MKAFQSSAMLSMAVLFSLSACKTPGQSSAPSSVPRALTLTRQNFPQLDE